MLYLTCTMISSVDFAHYRVSPAKDWVSVDCGTSHITCPSSSKWQNITGLRFRLCIFRLKILAFHSPKFAKILG